jgi:ribosomal protein S27E
MAYVGGNVRTLETVKSEDINRQCPDCGARDIEYANEEFYCKKCGLVLE